MEEMQEAKRKSQKASSRMQSEKPRQITFEFVFESWIEDRVKNNYWKNDERGEINTRRLLERYAYPLIGVVGINEIDTSHIHDCLYPIGQNRHSSATKLKGHLFLILQWSIAMKYRKKNDNPADYRDSLGILLEPLQTDRKPKENFAACDLKEIPRLFAELGQLN